MNENMNKDFEAILETIIGLTREEIQSIDLEQSKTGGIGWTIKLYSLISESTKLANKIASVDRQCRSAFLNEPPLPPMLLNMTPCNKIKDPIVSMEVVRSIKGTYSVSIKYRSKPNEEFKMVEEIKRLRDIIFKMLEMGEKK